MSPWLTDVFLATQCDERLVELARSGHEPAFIAIVRRYRPELARAARRICRDERAEDAVQQTLLSAFTALREGADVKHLRGWLHAILRNTALRLPVPALTEATLDEVALTSPSLEDEMGARGRAVEALGEIARLPARQREAFVAMAINGQSRSEVAETLGLTEGAVRQLVHRARAAVRTAVTALTPYPLARWALRAQTGGFAGPSKEMVLGAGVSSAGAAAAKIGAVLAVSVAAGGFVAAHAPAHHGGRGVHTRTAVVEPAASLSSGGRLRRLALEAVSAGGAGSGRATTDAGGGQRAHTAESSGRDGGGPGAGGGSDSAGVGLVPGPSATDGHGQGGGSGSDGAQSSDGGPTVSGTDGSSGAGAGGGSGTGRSAASDGASAASAGTATTSTSGSDGGSSGSSGSNSSGDAGGGSGSAAAAAPSISPTTNSSGSGSDSRDSGSGSSGDPIEPMK